MEKTGVAKTGFIFMDNSFDLIRYIAAFSVMFNHFGLIYGQFVQNGNFIINSIRTITTFIPGVVVLFSLSGFLISSSYERSKNKKEFFLKRVLRMYPELWVCTIVNLLVVIILAHKLLDKSILVWVVTQIFGIANTPSCLSTFATGSINGALWTIFTEVQLYIVLGFTYKWLKKLSNEGWIILLVILAGINLLAHYAFASFGDVVSKFIERFCMTYALWFFIGVFCYLKRDALIPLIKKTIPILLLAYVISWAVSINIPGYYVNIAMGVLLPFLVIGGGYLLPKTRFSCDLSYEIFLYHWIVLNVIVHFELINKLPWTVCILIFTVATLILSWLSWRFVGKGRKRRQKVDY